MGISSTGSVSFVWGWRFSPCWFRMTLSLVTKNFDLGVVYTCFLSIKCPKALAGRGLAPDHMHWGAIALSQNWRGEGLAAALRPTGLGFRPFMPKTTPNPMSFLIN